jgi:hypothetical protein
MKIQLLLLSLIISIFSIAQPQKDFQLNDLYGSINLFLGYCSYSYTLDTNFTFSKKHSCCTFDSTIESGKWRLENDQSLILISDSNSLKYSIKRVKDYLFFILEDQKDYFDEYLRCFEKKYQRIFKHKGERQANWYSHYYLMRGYYYKQLSIP